MDKPFAPLSHYTTRSTSCDRLAREDYGIIFITEQVAQAIGETIDRYNKSATPGIILIPSNSGSLGAGLARVRDNVERAVGMNILD